MPPDSVFQNQCSENPLFLLCLLFVESKSFSSSTLLGERRGQRWWTVYWQFVFQYKRSPTGYWATRGTVSTTNLVCEFVKFEVESKASLNNGTFNQTNSFRNCASVGWHLVSVGVSSTNFRFYWPPTAPTSSEGAFSNARSVVYKPRL